MLAEASEFLASNSDSAQTLKFQGSCHLEFKYIHGQTQQEKLCRESIHVPHYHKQNDRINEAVDREYFRFLFERKVSPILKCKTLSVG